MAIYAVTGAQGTGKSSLIRGVKDSLHTVGGDIIHFESESRILWKEFMTMYHLKDWQDASPEIKVLFQFALNTKRAAQICEVIKYDKDAILDRSTLDSAAYVIKHMNDGTMDKTIGFYLLKESEKILRLVDVTFFLKPEFPLEDDGFRSFSPEEQYEISGIMEDLLIKWDVPYMVLSGDVEQRVRTVHSVIDNRCFFNQNTNMIEMIGG
jgi:nicotinamide riboside kinase